MRTCAEGYDFTMDKHILICGRRSVGKTTLVERMLRQLKGPVYGFQTAAVQTEPGGPRHICMYPAGKADGHVDEANHICDGGAGRENADLSVFDGLGVRLIEAARPGGVIVMDEIGFLETGSEHFCDAVLKALDGEIPVLATVKDTDLGAEFLDRVRRHPRAELIMLDAANREEVTRQVEEILRKRGLLADKKELDIP